MAKITFEGPGFRYALFEVKPDDMPDFYDKDRGLMLRNRFKEYLEEDCKRVAEGKTSRMIQFCTLIDGDRYPAQVTLIDGNSNSSCHLSKLAEWRFVVGDAATKRCVANLPEGMPNDYIETVKSLMADYIDSVDDMTIDTLNNEYITFFNLYTPDGKMLLCMRSRDKVCCEFDVPVPLDNAMGLDRICVLSRNAQAVSWGSNVRHREYDAHTLVYDGHWYTGIVHSQREENVEYFVTGVNPSAIDARWFESWAM